MSSSVADRRRDEIEAGGERVGAGCARRFTSRRRADRLAASASRDIARARPPGSRPARRAALRSRHGSCSPARRSPGARITGRGSSAATGRRRDRAAGRHRGAGDGDAGSGRFGQRGARRGERRQAGRGAAAAAVGAERGARPGDARCGADGAVRHRRRPARAAGARQRRHRADGDRGGALGDRRRRAAHPRPAARRRGRGGEAGGAERQRAGRRVLDRDRSSPATAPGCSSFDPRQEIARVIVYAHAHGRNRFAALAPNGPYGDIAVAALRDATAVAGASLGRVARYDPARRISARRCRPSPRRRSISTPCCCPRAAQRLKALAPLLAVLRRRSRPGEAARHRAVGRLRARHRAGARGRLVRGAGARRARRDFEKRFLALYKHPPPLLATLGYDATALAAVLARAPDGPDFSAAALTNPSGFAGLNGIFRLLPDGIVERGLAVLEVHRTGATVDRSRRRRASSARAIERRRGGVRYRWLPRRLDRGRDRARRVARHRHAAALRLRRGARRGRHADRHPDRPARERLSRLRPRGARAARGRAVARVPRRAAGRSSGSAITRRRMAGRSRTAPACRANAGTSCPRSPKSIASSRRRARRRCARGIPSWCSSASMAAGRCRRSTARRAGASGTASWPPQGSTRSTRWLPALRGRGARADDLYDACALALAARAPHGPIPCRAATDARGLRMEIWY